MSLARQAIASFRWLLAARLAAQAITWAITIVVIRLLSPADYGLVAMAMLAIALFALINELGIGAALVQQQELDEETVRQAYGLLLGFNAALYALAYVLAPAVAALFEEPELTPIVRALALQLPIAAIGVVPLTMLRRRMAFKSKSTVDFATMVAGGAVTLACALAGFAVWSLVIGQLVSASTATIGYILAARYPCRPRFSFTGMAGSLKFGGLVTTNSVLWFLYSQADTFLIGKILGKEALGFYSVARTLASLPMEKLMGSLNEVGFAAFSRIQTQRELLREHFIKLTRLVSLFAFPVFFGISAVAPEVIEVLLAKKWATATFPLQILSVVIPLRMLSTITSPVMFALGRADVPAKTLLVACLIMPGAFLVGIRWGLDGVALAWLAAFPIQFSIVLMKVLPVIGVAPGDYLRAMREPALAAAIMYGVLAVVRWQWTGSFESGLAALLVLVVLGVLVFAAGIWVLRREAYTELLTLIRP